MSLSLTINGVDFTSSWRLYESRWTSRAYMGESSQSEFVIDDDADDHLHTDLAARKIVEVWEDASGSAVCMYRGRIANKTLGRGKELTGDAMRWTVTTEDYNIDLRGIRVDSSERPAESDYTRVIAYRTSYLQGASSPNANARDSTSLGTAFVINADTTTLPAETYTDTFPSEVYTRIAELSAKNFFVFVDDAGDGQLYYASHTDTSYSSDISITDAGTADGVDIFAPYVSENTGDHAGQQLVSGGSIRYGNDQFYEASDIYGSEAFHDKWEDHYTDEYITNADIAQAFIQNKVASLNNEEFTYIGIIDMRAEDAHRIKAGMMVPLRMASANKPTSTEQRAVQVTHEPQHSDENGNAWYKVTIELGVPRGRPFQRHIRSKPGPFAPSQPTEGACTRLYLTSDDSAIQPVEDAAWEGEAHTTKKLNPVHQETYTATSWSVSTAGSGGTPTDIMLWQGSYSMPAGLAAILAAGGATIRMQARTNARNGVGINESAQELISQIGVRVTQGATNTIRGTALSLHSIASAEQSQKWPASSVTRRNRVFPPDGAPNVLSAVSGAAAGDHLLIEVGYRNFTVPISGGNLWLNDQSATADFPEDLLETAALNPWLDICTADSAGSTTAPVGGAGSADPGDDNVYSPIDHIHEHGLLSESENLYHDAVDIEYDNSTSLISADNVQEAIDELVAAGVTGDHGTLAGLADNDHPQYRLTTDGGQDVISVVAAAGSTETLNLANGNVHDVTLTDDCTLTLTGATAGVACDMTILFRQGTGAPHLVTWPASVEWVGDSAPTLQTGENAWDWVALRTLDGGTTWFGQHGGTSSGESGRWEVVMSGTAPPVGVTNEAEDDWLYALVSP